MTTPEETAALERVLAEATPLPWRTLDQYIDSDTGPLPIATGWYDHMVMEGGQHHEAAIANAKLIVAAVNALPALLDLARRTEAAEKRVGELEAGLRVFACRADMFDGLPPPKFFGDTSGVLRYYDDEQLTVTLGDLRAARALITPIAEGR